VDKVAIQTLKGLYQEQVSAIASALTRARAQVALSAWEQAETQYQEILAASATSYSTTGRTITKRDIDRATAARDRALSDLSQYIDIGADSGTMSIVSNGGAVW
jgi:4-hydroxy-3-methylbut-2-enyl diphosphate reductase IspH